MVGRYSGVLSDCGDSGFFSFTGDLREPLPARPGSIPVCPVGVPLPWGEVTLWVLGVTTLFPGEVIRNGGDEARGVPPRDRGVVFRLGVPCFPDFSFRLPRLGVLTAPAAWKRSASRSSRSWKWFFSCSYLVTLIALLHWIVARVTMLSSSFINLFAFFNEWLLKLNLYFTKLFTKW